MKAFSLIALALSVVQGAPYLRPRPVGDLELIPATWNSDSDEPAAEQVQVRLVSQTSRSWTVQLQYLQSSSFDKQETRCSCNVQGRDIEGSGFSRTYSTLQRDHGNYNRNSDLYTSPYVHHCDQELPGESFAICTVQGGDKPVAKFWTPPMRGIKGTSFKFAVVADVGQTKYANATMHGALKWIRENNVSTLLFAGDISYADGEQERWESFGRLAQPLLSSVPTIFAPGNHELSLSESYVAYNHRYSVRHRELWFGESRGPVHFITLNSYSRSEPGSAQYRWLENELRSIDRDSTPWVVAQFHAPWFCSNPSHKGESNSMRDSMEPLFVKYNVDLVLSGHVHAYERSLPMRHGKLAECGQVYIVVGDGGNREEASLFDSKKKIPDWSAFRQSSFGFGSLEVIDENKSKWTWHRNPHDFDHFPDQPITPAQSFSEQDIAIIDRTGCRTNLLPKRHSSSVTL